ncbi:glycosyltransferase [Micromonospora sp. CP22]|uniref:glycosyltransferase n=1 Tax=Micromonospora sp. CP22 TaxID=2580517 RepID=UPI0012BD0A4B|nr:glycosyltransferase [Micromonospora sp. CP22]MTK04614.1 glycosyltransferase family 1 protein [Micromonospora sp. CP22]
MSVTEGPAARRPIMFASPSHPGQLNPLLTIAAEMSRRGEPDLWFSVDVEGRHRVEAATLGSPVRYLPGADTPVRIEGDLYAAMTRGPRTTAGLAALARTTRTADATAQVYERNLAHIERVRPRLMVIDVMNLGALDAATTMGVPYVLSVPYPISAVYLSRLPWGYPTPTSGLPRRLTGARRLTNALYRVRLQAALLRAVAGPTWRRRAQGLANATGDPARYAADAVAVFGYTVFGLEYPFPAPDHLHLLGAMVPQEVAPGRSHDELTEWLDRQPSVVYVCLGTLATLTTAQLDAFAEALGRLGPEHQVLWKLPDAQRAALTRLPPNVRVQEWIPSQLEVLAHPRVRAFVCHGGANGFHEGVHFGQPMLVTPFWLDCYDIAARAVDAGVGLALDAPPRVDPDEVAGKLRRLLSEDGFRQRSRYWGEQSRKAGGVARAADLLRQFAGRDQWPRLSGLGGPGLTAGRGAEPHPAVSSTGQGLVMPTE